ncbi:hypothetical protein AFL01nite_01780 [Aeromicrobium flavum]|uniref:Uncharacterized protein n=1 Tax=Aeromicrobium flavum TaxID=416568 RepID=A0A512HQX1_9ACTN|nr:hypothetical protein [Aeromicrobium flavum]GEO87851.1 hypothetical protein AFL01nite_01780 [Aeromicrobium flavum]
MKWFTPRSPRDRSIALTAPTLEGSTWPPADPAARSGFGAATTHRLGLDAAFTPEAHEIADLLTARLLPLLPFEASAEDLPHVVHLLRSAAQAGAGIGIVDARDTSLAPGRMGADVAGALGEADRDLPPMPASLRACARYLLHAGHHVARVGTGVVPALEAALERSTATD